MVSAECPPRPDFRNESVVATLHGCDETFDFDSFGTEINDDDGIDDDQDEAEGG